MQFKSYFKGNRPQLETLKMLLPNYNFISHSKILRSNQFDDPLSLFYDSNRVALKDSGTFWLSTTPHIPRSISWDASQPRIAIWAVLFNLHFCVE
jgi:hypothetical protein